MRDRLNEVKENAVTTKQHDFITELPYEDFEWLIERAEKAEELESMVEWLKMLKSKESEDRGKTYQALNFIESLSKKQLGNLIKRHEGNPSLKEMLCSEADK